jgi:hypothetical protein
MVVLLIVMGTAFVLLALAIRLATKPCPLCLEGVEQHIWGQGEVGHIHPRTKQLVECGSLQPICMREDS